METETTTAFSIPDLSVCKTEVFDIDMAKQLLSNESISKEERRILKTYLGRRKEGNKVPIKYVLGAKVRSETVGTKLKSDFLGRLIAEGGVGLQFISRDIRGALAKPYYWDIDMKNAQPVILLQIAKQKGWEHSCLERFINQREEVMKEYMESCGATRSEAKDRFIQLFFGSSYIDGLPDWIGNELYPELCKMKYNIYTSNTHMAKKLKKNQNSIMAYVLQTQERECLLSMDRAFARNNRSLDVYMHDGGYIRKLENETEFPTEMMRKVEHEVFKETGFRIHLHQKPIETSFLTKESNFTIYPADTIIDDVFAGRKFVEMNAEDLVYCRGFVYVFNSTTGIWSDNVDELNLKLTQAGESLIFRKDSSSDTPIIYNYSGSVKNRENLKKVLPTLIEPNNMFIEEGRKKSCFKLLFKDGIYDFKEQTFIPGFDRTCVFSTAIPRNFPQDVPQEDVEFINKTFFKEPFANEDTPRVFKHYIMRGILGDYRIKKFLVMLGDANSSKGTFSVMCSYALGENAITFNANNLLLKKNQGDAEREFSWIGGIANSRLSFSNEIKNTDGIKIDGNMLKTITGGGDEIVMRKLYRESEKIFNFSLPILFAQDLPEITPPDAINSRIILLQYDYSFMENPNPNRKNEKQADPNIKDTLCCDKYANAFISLVIQEYNNWADTDFAEIVLPDFMIQDKEAMAPTTDIRSILEEEYRFTGNEEDFVPFTDIKDLLNRNKITMSDTRIGRELTRLNLFSFEKKVDRKKFRGRTGLVRL